MLYFGGSLRDNSFRHTLILSNSIIKKTLDLANNTLSSRLRSSGELLSDREVALSYQGAYHLESQVPCIGAAHADIRETQGIFLHVPCSHLVIGFSGRDTNPGHPGGPHLIYGTGS